MDPLSILTLVTSIGGMVMGAQNAKRQASAAEAQAKAAANSHSTTEEIKHLSPAEQQALGMQSYIGATKWKEFQQANSQQNLYKASQGSIGSNFLLPGQAALQQGMNLQTNNYDRDSEYAAYEFLRKSRTSLLAQIEMLGIDDGSGKNPYGVKISYDDYEELMRMKDPSLHITNGTSMGDPATEEEIWATLNILRPQPGYKAPAEIPQAVPKPPNLLNSLPAYQLIKKSPVGQIAKAVGIKL